VKLLSVIDKKGLFRYVLTMADQNQPKEKEDDEEISSSTLIKFESYCPRQFATLPAAVDLKRPPSNW
jgi:hypothetical protein